MNGPMCQVPVRERECDADVESLVTDVSRRFDGIWPGDPYSNELTQFEVTVQNPGRVDGHDENGRQRESAGRRQGFSANHLGEIVDGLRAQGSLGAAQPRPTRFWPTLLAAPVMAFAILTAACGGGDEEGASDPSTASATQARSATPSPGQVFANLDFPAALIDGQAIGKSDAPITLTAFEDFQCPFCLRFTLLNEPVIIEEYVLTGKVRFEFKHFPILGDESGAAAVAASCAADQGRFWDLHKRLFLLQLDAGQLTAEKLNVGRFSVANLQQYAIDGGLDSTAFNACLISPEASAKVTAEFRAGANLGLRGTPSFLINGQPVANPPATPAEWRTFLDAQLKATPSGSRP